MGGYFFGSKILGKKFASNCWPVYAKKPQGPVWEGVQGGVCRGYLVGLIPVMI